MNQEGERENRFSEHVLDWRNSVMDRVLGLFPRQTAEHLVNAQKEGILAIQSLLERGIETLDGDLKRVQEWPPKNP